MSAAAFCRERDLSYAQYMYWQRRLGNPVRALVPVRVDAAATPAASLSVEVALTGSSLRVSGMAIADVVALVRGLAC